MNRGVNCNLNPFQAEHSDIERRKRALSPPQDAKKEKIAKNRKFTVESEPNDGDEDREGGDDSDAQFLRIVARHFREPSLSKRAKLELQGEILSAIARHVS